MTDLNRSIGRLEQAAEDMRGDIHDLRAQVTSLNALLNQLMPKLEQAAKHAADWETTKKRGMLYLAAAGATGIASTLGFQKLGPIFFAILK